MFRQKKYICANFMDAEIFTRAKNEKKFKRAKKVKESSSAQKNLNNKKAQRYFTRLIHLNFNEQDLYIDISYDKEHMPESREEAYRDVKKYLDRIRYWRKKNGLPPLKYIYVISDIDKDGNKARIHHHIIVNDMDRDVAERLWGKGYANTDRLQFDEHGVTGKSLYMARQAKGEKSWGSSKGLKRPEPKVSDKAITRADAERIKRNPEDREFFEKKYPGWIFTDCKVTEDDINGTSFYIRMRRYDPKPKKTKKDGKK